MGHWWEEYAAKYGDRIRNNQSSFKRISSMTRLPFDHAKALGKFIRRGELPTLPHPDDCQPESPATVTSPAEREADGETEHPGVDYALKARYFHDAATDTYVTPLRDAPGGFVQLAGDVHRAILRAYSSADGAPASVNAVAREFRMPRPWVKEYLRAHGMTHDQVPFAVEELMSRADADLLNDMRQMRIAAVHQKMERDKWRHLEEDAQRWREFEANIMGPLLAAFEHRKPVKIPRLELPTAQSPYAAFIGLTDFHWGKYSDPGENFTRYNRAIARQRLFAATRMLMGELAMRGRPEVIYIPIGSDFLHIDNQQGQTTNGTPQDCDGTAAELFVTGCDLLEEWIGMLRQVGPVELVLMSANHDRMAGVMMQRCMEAAYRSTPDVTVRMERTPRAYINYGECQIMLAHGDGVAKPADLAMHMAMEDAENWHRPYKTALTGHRHNEKTRSAQPGADTAYSVTCRQMPSIAGTDRWHALKGYIGAPKALPMYVFDKSRGMIVQALSPVPVAA